MPVNTLVPSYAALNKQVFAGVKSTYILFKETATQISAFRLSVLGYLNN